MIKHFRLLAIVGLACVFTLLSFTGNKKIIVIDAGHGGKDFGAMKDNHVEKDIVRSIAEKIRTLNTNSDYEFVLIRDSDAFVDLRDRVAAIESYNPEMVISLHVDSQTDMTANGVNALVSSENKFYEKSHLLAESLIESVSKDKLKRGKTATANLFIIKNSPCPAVNLLLGNMSNKADMEYITSETGQRNIALSIIEAAGK